MRILTLCYEYPPIGGGGGRVAKTVAEGLAARGHEVRVQTAALGFRSQKEMINGVDVRRTASFRRAPDTCRVYEMGLFWMTSLLPTIAHAKQWKPDVMHAHFAMPTGLLAWEVHRLTGVPYVITAHLGDVPGGVPEQTDKLFRMIGPLPRWVWSEAAGCTAVSSFVQELAQNAYARPVERILNGIDLSDAPPEPAVCNAERHLVFLGRFNPQKRPEFLLDALGRIQATNWRLTFIGDGPLMSETRRLVESHGLASRVRFEGWLAGEQVQSILRSADILCMPSSSEGMPVAAVEALKNGLAIATCDIPGVRDVVQDGVNGFRTPVNEPAAYAARLEELLQSDELLLRMRKASWSKARDFELSHVVDAYERVLSDSATRR